MDWLHLVAMLGRDPSAVGVQSLLPARAFMTLAPQDARLPMCQMAVNFL